MVELGGIPTKMATFIASTMYDFRGKDLELAFVQPGNEGRSHDLHVPVSIVHTKEAKEYSGVDNVLKSALAFSEVQALADLPTAKKALSRSGATPHCCKALKHNDTIDFNRTTGSSDEPLFKVDDTLAPVLFVQKANSVMTDAGVHPLNGLGGWLSVLQGIALIFFFKLEDVIAEGFTIDT